MDIVALLGDRLLRELEFRSVEELDLAESHRQNLDRISFLAMRTYLGSLIAVGLVAADGLGPQDIAGRFGHFESFFDTLLEIGPTARGLVVDNLTGRSGLLAFVFQTPPSDDQIEHIRGLRYGSAAKLGYCRAWAIDVKNTKVHKHRGFPLKIYPSKRFFQETLRQ